MCRPRRRAQRQFAFLAASRSRTDFVSAVSLCDSGAALGTTVAARWCAASPDRAHHDDNGRNRIVQLWLYTLGSVAAVSLVALIGLFALSRAKEATERMTPYLVSLAVGALLGGSVLHLIARAVQESGTGLRVWLSLLGGFGHCGAKKGGLPRR